MGAPFLSWLFVPIAAPVRRARVGPSVRETRGRRCGRVHHVPDVIAACGHEAWALARRFARARRLRTLETARVAWLSGLREHARAQVRARGCRRDDAPPPIVPADRLDRRAHGALRVERAWRALSWALEPRRAAWISFSREGGQRARRTPPVGAGASRGVRGAARRSEREAEENGCRHRDVGLAHASGLSTVRTSTATVWFGSRFSRGNRARSGTPRLGQRVPNHCSFRTSAHAMSDLLARVAQALSGSPRASACAARGALRELFGEGPRGGRHGSPAPRDEA